MDKIKQYGVIYTIQNDVCVDIDIPSDMTVLTLGPDTNSINGISFKLRGVFKQFPNIQELVITENVEDIEISNFMFPNVKNVTSHNRRYPSGSSLISFKGYGYDYYYTLLNAFCKEDPIRDVYLEKRIRDYALEGSFTKTLSDNVKVYKNSFSGYVLEPPQDGINMRECAILRFDENTDEIIIPPEATEASWADNVHACLLPQYKEFKKITITCNSQLALLPHSDVIEVLNIESLQIELEKTSPLKVKNYQVIDVLPRLKTQDSP